MRKVLFFMLLISVTVAGYAQHCPWDCTGMILVKTSIPKEKFDQLNVVLVDEQQNEITDTIYGTGKDTYDECRFLAYDDFMHYRKKKVALHHWYGFDTMYFFAEGLCLVKFNFCKYQDKKIFIKFLDPYNPGPAYHYVEVPASQRIHLHDYSTEIFQMETGKLKKLLQPYIIYFDCDKWLLHAEDCK